MLLLTALVLVLTTEVDAGRIAPLPISRSSRDGCDAGRSALLTLHSLLVPAASIGEIEDEVGNIVIKLVDIDANGEVGIVDVELDADETTCNKEAYCAACSGAMLLERPLPFPMLLYAK